MVAAQRLIDERKRGRFRLEKQGIVVPPDFVVKGRQPLWGEVDCAAFLERGLFAYHQHLDY